MKKSVLVLLALVSMCLPAFANGNGDADNTNADQIEATILWRRFDDPFQSGFRIIMQSEADKMGDMILNMQDGENDPSRMLNKIEMSLTKGVENIAICAPDRGSTKMMMETCREEGVPVVFFNMEPMPETMQAYDKVWYVGANAKESGQMCAQALINYWNDNNSIADKNNDGILQLIIIQGEIGQQDVVLRTQAYEETLNAQGLDYEVLAMDTANWDKAQAMDKMNAWITAFGIDGIEGVLCNSDGMAMGAVQACLNNGYNTGDPEKFIPVVGIDATVEALQSMKEGGLLGTVLNDRVGQSRAVLDVMKAVNSGLEITEDVIGVDCTVDDNYIWVPYAIVDSSNLESTLSLMVNLEGK